VRAYTSKRLEIEYARIQRVAPGQPLFDLPPFIDDFAGLLQASIDYQRPAEWSDHVWAAGSLNLREPETTLVGKIGWASEGEEDLDAPPSYHDGIWDDDIPRRRRGAVALFTVDADSQWMGVAAQAGTPTISAVCRTIEQILNREEPIYQREVIGRPPRIQWFVEPLPERGIYRAWLQTVASLTRLRISFHLPNPYVNEQIASSVGFLNDVEATNGRIEAWNEDGSAINPAGSPLMSAGLEMHEEDYAEVIAGGIDHAGQRTDINTHEHTMRDVREDMPDRRRPTVTEAFALLFEALADRIRRYGAGGHGTQA
jgi:hypothetical protein